MVLLLASGGVLAWFNSWRSDRMARLQMASGIAGTSAGPVEFVQSGDGPAVLVFHASPGGYDQAMLFGGGLADEGFQVLAPSRPGYLRTPLASGPTPEKQADAMAALLDDLNVESVAVLGISLGAPAAIEFARRYPGRTWALVLVSAVTGKLVSPPGGSSLPETINKNLAGDMGSWVLVETAKRDPARALGWMFALGQRGESAAKAAWIKSVLERPGQLRWFRHLVGTLAPISPRKPGLRNDILQMRDLPDYSFGHLTLPTLFIHGAEDKFLPIADIQIVESRMSNAELLALPNTGHIVELGPDSQNISKHIASFLKQFSGGHGSP